MCLATPSRDRPQKDGSQENATFLNKTTVKPLIFICPLFCEFFKLNKTDKLTYTQLFNGYRSVHAQSDPSPGLPGLAGTRRNIHPLTPILIIRRPL